MAQMADSGRAAYSNSCHLSNMKSSFVQYSCVTSYLSHSQPLSAGLAAINAQTFQGHLYRYY